MALLTTLLAIKFIFMVRRNTLPILDRSSTPAASGLLLLRCCVLQSSRTAGVLGVDVFLSVLG